MLEVPVGFKWFVDGLIDGSLGFVGEESAGASFLRRNGTVWTTDKDGLIMGLLAAEMTAVTGKDPGVLYGELTAKYGDPVYQRIDAAGDPGAEGQAGQAVALAGHGEDAGGRADHGDPDGSARQPRADRRAEGDDRKRLVRRAAQRDRRCLQDLCGELQRRGAFEADSDGGASIGNGGNRM